MIKKYTSFVEGLKTLINEFNQQDKELIRKLDEYFTIAIEYEVCANESPDMEPPIEDENVAIEHAIEQTKLDLSRGKTEGSYGFAEVKWTEGKFRENEEKMLLNNPNFNTLTKKKQKSLHSEYKTLTWFNNFIDNLVSMVDFDDQEETDEAIFSNDYEDELEQAIVSRFSYNISLFCFGQNIQYLKDRVIKKLPNFWKKWGSTFKFELEGDMDKQRILEFSPKTYLSGISQGISQLEDFYNDFNKQDYWYFNNRTALHINVGVKSKDTKWNPIKGLLLMGDYGREEKEALGKKPYVFKGIEWRYGNRFTGSLIDTIKKTLKDKTMYKIEDEEELSRRVRGGERAASTGYGDSERDKAQSQINDLKNQIKTLTEEKRGKSRKEKEVIKSQISDLQKQVANLNPAVWNYDVRKREEIFKQPAEIKANINLLDLNDIKKFEDFFNEFLVKANKSFYIKEFGIKLTELDKNYVEFRYIGTKISDDILGGVSQQIMIDKMYYFCYIVYLMTNDDYKKREYHKKLYKLTEEVKSYID